MVKQCREPRAGEVEAFLAVHGKQLTRFGDELRFRPCPKCGHDKRSNRSVSINTKSGLWNCFACGEKGNFFGLAHLFGSPIADAYISAEIDYAKEFRFLEHFKTPSKKRRPVTGGHYPELLDYCHKRGISDETLNLFKVSTMGPENLRFPLFSFVGSVWEILNMRVRKVLGRESSYGARDWFEVSGGPTGLMIGIHLLDLTQEKKRVMIFEGQWDVMSAYEIGLRNVFSLPNGYQNIKAAEMLRYIPEDWEVWLCLDMDEQGELGVEKFYAQLGGESVARMVLPKGYKDLNEWHMKEPELTAEKVESTVRGHTKLVQEVVSLRNSTKDFEDNVFLVDEDAIKNQDGELIVDTPWSTLTEYMAGGFRSAETTGVLAPSGIGKTTLVNHIAIYVAQQGVTVGLLSVEGTRKKLKLGLRNVAHSLCQHENEIETVKSHLKVSGLRGTDVSWQDSVTEIEKMLREPYGCKVVIIDNLDYITRNESMMAKVEAYGEIMKLVEDYRAHALVVWQPNKIDRAQAVNSGNQKGQSQFLQDAANYINMNRFSELNRIEVEKVREAGTGLGYHLWLAYDSEAHCYHEIKDKTQIESAINGQQHPQQANVIDIFKAAH